MQHADFGSGRLDDAQQEQFKRWVRGLDERPTKARAVNHMHAAFGVTIPLAQVGPLIDSALGVVRDPTAGDPLRLPGYGLPLDYWPGHECFPVLVGGAGGDWAARTLLVREVCMLKLIEDITNKPEWWRKVRDAAIAAKWKKEACRLDWGAYRRHADFTPAMADACMEELGKKADLYDKTGLIPVLDYSACVVKSDRLIPQALVDRLKAAVAPLENVPRDRKDWHPGSDEKVLDLVHPSLWPLLYGRSRILRDQRMGVENCLEYYGRGFVVPEPDEPGPTVRRPWHTGSIPPLSTRFQWLPCDVALGEDGGASIESYINNVHPVEHAQLYPVIQAFIEKALPAWDIVYRWVSEFQVQRLMTWKVGRGIPLPDACDEGRKREGDVGEGVGEAVASPEGDAESLTLEGGHGRDEGSDEGEGSDDESDEDEVAMSDDAEPSDGSASEDDSSPPPSRFFHLTTGDVKSSGFFQGASRIQVIVKLANIHLTPEKPSYAGGSWHVEGQLNERICATALFYYDSDNITESRLAFRTPANGEELGEKLKYRQNDGGSIERAFAIRSDFDTLQDVGSVLTRAGRAIFFPNLFQHRVEPFSLADGSRPGHRKILALFLVDPAVPVISTAHVPPQQRSWWPGADEVRTSSRLPPEVAEMIVGNVDVLIDEPEAKRLREELMAERTVLQEQAESTLKGVEWSFCEH